MSDQTTIYCWACHAYSSMADDSRCGACGGRRFEIVTPRDHPDRRDPAHDCPRCSTPGMRYHYYDRERKVPIMERCCKACGYAESIA